MNSIALKKYLPAAFIAGLLLSGCSPEIDVPEAAKGNADFTKYISVGNSLTAGYMDGGLYREGQENSYPSILAQQFELVGGSDFPQPLFAENQKNGTGYLTLNGFDSSGNPSLAAVTTELAYRGGTNSAGKPLLAVHSGPNQNLAVPGMSVFSSGPSAAPQIPPYAAVNEYYERILTGQPITTPYSNFVGQNVRKTRPTFFTLWLGNIDVLSFATGGGEPTPTNPFDDLTNPAFFEARYKAMLDTLTQTGAKGVVANIPSVTNVPFFTTVRVDDVKARIKAINASASLYIKTGAGTTREATSSDLLLLTSLSEIGKTTAGSPFPVGSGLSPTLSNPLDSKYVLDSDEVLAVQTHTQNLNTIIASAAAAKQVPLVNMNAFFNSIQPKDGKATLYINAVGSTPAFISGNLFSLDGVHPTPRGYAVVANEFIKTINAFYGSSIPQVNPNDYRAVLFP
jgi:hypothetical protein